MKLKNKLQQFLSCMSNLVLVPTKIWSVCCVNTRLASFQASMSAFVSFCSPCRDRCDQEGLTTREWSQGRNNLCCAWSRCHLVAPCSLGMVEFLTQFVNDICCTDENAFTGLTLNKLVYTRTLMSGTMWEIVRSVWKLVSACFEK